MYTPTDNGPDPYVTNVRMEALRNDNYRAAIWTGNHMQATVMSIPPGSDIGLEVHPEVDQFIYIMQGRGVAQMGSTKNNLTLMAPVGAGDGVFVPMGTWHNVTNAGRTPIKILTFYAPPQHPAGTVHPTKADAEAEGRMGQ